MGTAAIRTDRAPAARAAAAVLAVVTALAGCGRAVEPAADAAAESWSVTAWGGRYEIFPEVDALVAGEVAEAHTHVTVLDGFAPLAAGTVEIVLRRGAAEQVFHAEEAARPGIFTVEVAPEEPGEHDLVFRIRSPAGAEEIRGGRVRVGAAGAPGGVVRAPAPRGATGAGEPVPFLKEQQWRADFATAWVQAGTLPRSVRGLARVRPPAGGEATITAPVDGVLQSRPWPYPGATVREGQALFRLAPRVAAETSLPALEADVAGLESEHAAARARLGRLEELLALEATSRREVEDATARLATLDARLAAARRDLAAARAAREGRSGAGAHALAAPFAGTVASIAASPGAAVAAGDPLARLVRTDRAWLEVELVPEAARALAAGGVRGVVVADGEGAPRRIAGDEALLVSVAPEVDPDRGTVRALLEVRSPGLLLGTTVEAEVLLPGEREGIVVPTSALVDDGGTTVVYLQLSGERFVRQEVAVEARQGDLALVAGLVPGQRLVTRGGDAIRRATMMAGGEATGHVH